MERTVSTTAARPTPERCEAQAGEAGPSLGRHLLDALDPLFLLLGRRRGDPVHGVVALHHAPVRLGLAGLDYLVFIVRDIKLKAVLRSKKGGREQQRSE